MEERIGVLIISDRRGSGRDLLGPLMTEPSLRLAGMVSCDEATSLVRRLRPGVIVYEPSTADSAELRRVEPVVREAPYAPVVVVSAAATTECLREAMAIGVREFLARPVTAERLAAAVRSVHASEREARHYRAARGLLLATERRPRLFVVFATKGGVGKTTLAVNLAVALARETSHLVPVVDLEQGSGGVSMFLGLARPASHAGLTGGPATGGLTGPADQDLETTFSQIERRLVRHHLNVAVLSPHGCPGRARAQHVRRILELLACGHDLTVVDTYPAFDEATGAALELADVVLLVTTPDLPTIHNAGEALAALARGRRLNGRVRLVVNRAGPGAELDPRVIEDYLGLPVFGTIDDAPTVVGRSMNLGQPFVAWRPRSRIARDVAALATELLRQ
ncbi:MAG: AAA family ATPase [Bacillota bacterium]